MSLQWEPLALFSIVGNALVLLLAVWIFRAQRGDPLNRIVALYLSVIALSRLAFFGIRLLMAEPEWAYASAMTFYPFALCVPLVTFLLILQLKTPVLDPLRGPVGFVLLGSYTAAVLVTWAVYPEGFVEGVARFEHIDAWSIQEGSLGLYLVNVPNTIAALAALVVSISAARADGIAGQKARAFRDAFLASNILFVVYAFLLTWPGVGWLESDRIGIYVNFLWPALTQLIVAFLLVTGILRTQLVDAGSRLRRTLSAGVLTVTLGIFFFAASEGLERVLPFESTTFTIMAAAAIALVMRPLRNFVDTSIDLIMPPAAESDDESRRWAVYRDALHTAWEDGQLQRRDRVLLAALQDRLGLTERDARRLEREVKRDLQRSA